MGTCYGALRLGKAVREVLPKAKIALGGGFVGSQMRDLNEPAVFGFVDYIRRYDPAPAERTVDRMEQLAAQSGWTGFCLVDAAAPPKLLKALSQVLLERGLCFTWLTDIRFERAFEARTPS